MSQTGSLLALAAPVLLGAGACWLAYLRFKDRRLPEPWVLLAASAALGGVAVALAWWGYERLDDLGLGVVWTGLQGPWPQALGAAALIGAVEEAAKLLPVLPLALGSRHFDEPWDGAVYAGASGVGFALAEAAVLAASGEMDAVTTLARAAAAPISHALFAAPAGLGLAWAVLRRSVWALPAGFAVAVAAHAGYDLLLARGLQLAAAGWVGVLWIVWLRVAARLAQDPAGDGRG